MSVPTWNLAVNWNNDADFSDTGEDVTNRVLPDRGIAWERGRSQVNELAEPMAGTFKATLDNRSRDYSPANGSSPLAGNLIPGRPVRWQATSGGTIPLWRGNLDDLPQEPGRGTRSVQLPALGTLAKLKGTSISSQVYTGIATSVAFGHVCRLAGLAGADYQSLDTGKTTLDIWWCNGDDAFAMLASIQAAEGPGAAIYEDGAGVVTFHSRHYRLLTARCNTSQATIRDTATSPFHTDPFGYNPNLKGVVNGVALTVKTATLAGVDTTVWSWTGSVQIPPGATAYWYMSLTDPVYNPAASVGFDVGHVSATFQSEAGGSIPVTGARIQLALVNDSDTFGGGGPAVAVTVSSISVLAKVYASVGDTVSNSADTSASQGKYGLRSLPTSYNPWPYIARSTAQDFADAIVGAYQEPRATVSITVPNADSTNLAQQLNREISDRVTVVEAQTGLNNAVIIEHIAHAVDFAGKRFVTTFGCEQVGVHDASLIWDVGNWDTNYFAF